MIYNAEIIFSSQNLIGFASAKLSKGDSGDIVDDKWQKGILDKHGWRGMAIAHALTDYTSVDFSKGKYPNDINAYKYPYRNSNLEISLSMVKQSLAQLKQDAISNKNIPYAKLYNAYLRFGMNDSEGLLDDSLLNSLADERRLYDIDVITFGENSNAVIGEEHGAILAELLATEGRKGFAGHILDRFNGAAGYMELTGAIESLAYIVQSARPFKYGNDAIIESKIKLAPGKTGQLLQELIQFSPEEVEFSMVIGGKWENVELKDENGKKYTKPKLIKPEYASSDWVLTGAAKTGIATFAINKPLNSRSTNMDWEKMSLAEKLALVLKDETLANSIKESLSKDKDTEISTLRNQLSETNLELKVLQRYAAKEKANCILAKAFKKVPENWKQDISDTIRWEDFYPNNVLDEAKLMETASAKADVFLKKLEKTVGSGQPLSSNAIPESPKKEKELIFGKYDPEDPKFLERVQNNDPTLFSEMEVN